MPNTYVNSNDILDAVRGVSYPCMRVDLIAQAEMNHADDSILEVLKALLVNEFKSSADVAQAIGDVERSMSKS